MTKDITSSTKDNGLSDQSLRRISSKPCFKMSWLQQKEEQDKAAYQRHCTQRLASVYNGNTTQAILFLKAIKANNRQPMQPFTIRMYLCIIYYDVTPCVLTHVFFFSLKKKKKLF